MRTLGRLCAASILTLALALSAFAGEIDTTFTSQSPPQHATTQGEIQTTSAGEIETTLTATTEIALSLISGVLSLI